MYSAVMRPGWDIQARPKIGMDVRQLWQGLSVVLILAGLIITGFGWAASSQPATATVNTPAQMTTQPEAAPGSLWQAFQASAADSDYNLARQSGNLWQAVNSRHNLRLGFDQAGVTVNGWALKLNAVGYEDQALQATAASQPQAHANRVEYQPAPGLREWYVNGPLGLEQGFTLERPLPTSRGDWLELSVNFAGVQVSQGEPGWLKLSDTSGQALGRYGQLSALDAAGRELPSQLEAGPDGQSARLLVKVAGAAYPLTIDPFIQQQELTEPNPQANDAFGYSVSLSADGSTALIGAYGTGVVSATNRGAAYVFTKSGATWTLQSKLTASDGADGDQFGINTALSDDGNTALIGAYLKTVNGNSFQGAAYIFSRSGTAWTQQKELTATNGASGDVFGLAVALSGDGKTALVGAPLKQVGFNSAQGVAYVFSNTVNGWTPQQTLTANDGAPSDTFGRAVALSGDGKTALIGAPRKSVGGNTQQGEAYAFVNSAGNWTQQQILTGNDSAANDDFGRAVSLSSDGNTGIIGADGKTVGAANNQGAAYAFTRAGTTWSQQTELLPADGTSFDLFGGVVSLSGDGKTAAVGASNKKVGSNALQGETYIFNNVSGTTWNQQPITTTDGASGDELGQWVQISRDGSTVLSGASSKTINGKTGAGAAYIFGYIPKVNSQLIINGNPNPSLVGQSVTFSISVKAATGSNPITATGVVTLTFDGGSPITVSLNGGVATYSTSTLTLGSHTLSVTYSGDTFYNPASGSYIQTVLAAGCSSTVVTSTADDGSCGTLRQAVLVASNGSNKTVTISLTTGSVINLSSGVKLSSGVAITTTAGCGPNGIPPVTLQGGTGNGLQLSGANHVYGVWVRGFSGVQIVAGSGGNTLRCVRASKA